MKNLKTNKSMETKITVDSIHPFAMCNPTLTIPLRNMVIECTPMIEMCLDKNNDLDINVADLDICELTITDKNGEVIKHTKWDDIKNTLGTIGVDEIVGIAENWVRSQNPQTFLKELFDKVFPTKSNRKK